MNNRPIGGHSSETYSHPIDINNNNNHNKLQPKLLPDIFIDNNFSYNTQNQYINF
jgi:hypothetical protein